MLKNMKSQKCRISDLVSVCWTVILTSALWFKPCGADISPSGRFGHRAGIHQNKMSDEYTFTDDEDPKLDHIADIVTALERLEILKPDEKTCYSVQSLAWNIVRTQHNALDINIRLHIQESGSVGMDTDSDRSKSDRKEMDSDSNDVGKSSNDKLVKCQTSDSHNRTREGVQPPRPSNSNGGGNSTHPLPGKVGSSANVTLVGGGKSVTKQNTENENDESELIGFINF